jgi:hypothetical protein
MILHTSSAIAREQRIENDVINAFPQGIPLRKWKPDEASVPYRQAAATTVRIQARAANFFLFPIILLDVTINLHLLFL